MPEARATYQGQEFMNLVAVGVAAASIVPEAIDGLEAWAVEPQEPIMVNKMAR